MRPKFSNLALAVALSFSLLSVPAQASSQAHILFLEGTVETQVPGAEWKTAQKGEALAQGSLIRTGKDSSCEIAMDGSNSVVRMKPDSQTALPTLTEDNILVDLKEGKVLVWLRDLPKGSSFHVASPAAVATARGTGWEQGMDAIQVFEHTVEVAGAAGDTQMLEEGQGVDFKEDGLGEPFEVPQDAKEEWENFQDDADKHITEEMPVVAPVAEETAAAPAAPAEASSETEKRSDDEDRLPMDPPNDPIMRDSSEGPEDTMDMMNSSPDMMNVPDTDTTDTMADRSNPMEDNAFDAFDNTFESPMIQDGSTASSGSTDDRMQNTLNEVQDQQQQTTVPPTFDPNITTNVCHDSSGSPYPC